MRSLSDVADKYEEWAMANEITAETIIMSACTKAMALEVLQHQQKLASWLRCEAEVLKARAVELRARRAPRV